MEPGSGKRFSAQSSAFPMLTWRQHNTLDLYTAPPPDGENYFHRDYLSDFDRLFFLILLNRYFLGKKASKYYKWKYLFSTANVFTGFISNEITRSCFSINDSRIVTLCPFPIIFSAPVPSYSLQISMRAYRVPQIHVLTADPQVMLSGGGASGGGGEVVRVDQCP